MESIRIFLGVSVLFGLMLILPTPVFILVFL